MAINSAAPYAAPNFIWNALRCALPDDVTIEEIVNPKASNIQEMDMEALAESLRNCKRLNWRVYLEIYEDVRAGNFDPALHFVRHGLFENRKLFSYPKEIYEFPIAHACGSAKISIIIPNYNNGAYLEKAIQSLINQSLIDIEIIMVDDCSEDNSVQIIENLMKADSRIKLVRLPVNSSQHMARKVGVSVATSDYIMFMDPDDAYTPDTCRIAYEHIIHGFDIVNFKINVVRNSLISEEEAQEAEHWHNHVNEGVYSRQEILDSALLNDGINISLVTKIISSPICKKAFQTMEDGYYTNWEDLYAFMAIAHRARNLKVIPDKLYNYNRGKGCSMLDNARISRQRYMAIGNLLGPLDRYCDKYNLHKYRLQNKMRLFNSSLYSFLQANSDKDTWEWMNALVGQYGRLFLIKELMKSNFHNHSAIGKRLSDLRHHCFKTVSNIVIFFNGRYLYERKKIALSLKELLSSIGYQVFIFAEQNDVSEPLPDFIDYKISKTFGTLSENLQHLEDINAGLIKHKVDLVIYLEGHSHMLLWDSLLCHTLGIKIFVILEQFLLNTLMYKKAIFTHESVMNSLRACDKVLSTSALMVDYCKINEVDAALLPQFHHRKITETAFNTHSTYIYCYTGDINHLDNINEILKIAKLINRYVRHIVLIIGYNSLFDEIKEEIYNSLQAMPVTLKVELQNATQDFETHLSHASLLLSTAQQVEYIHIFEAAQQMAIPIVMYSMENIDAQYGNIICVDRGEYKIAAQQAVKLLSQRNDVVSNSYAKKTNCDYDNAGLKWQNIINSTEVFSDDHSYGFKEINMLIHEISNYSN